MKRWHPQIAALEAGRIETVDATPFYVGVPTMTAVAKHLASALSVCLDTRITRIERSDEGWQLFDLDEQRHGPYAELVISAPAPQTAALVRGKTPLSAALDAAKLQPCWALLASCAERLPVPFDGIFFNDADSPLAWAARMGSKPERSATPDRWVLHAQGNWSERHLEEQPAKVEAALWQAFRTAVALALQAQPRGAAVPESVPKPASLTVHRWRYAYVAAPLEAGSLFDPIRRIGICGDWCQSGRVEGAFLSGRHLAEQMLQSASW